MRTLTLFLIAPVAFVVDLLAAYYLVVGLMGSGSQDGGTAAALVPLFSGWIPTAGEALLVHIVAVTLGTPFLSAVSSSPSAGDAIARWLLFLFLSLPLPGVGFALAYFATIALACSGKRLDDDFLFRVGNPLSDPAAHPSHSEKSPSASQAPLTARIRGRDLSDLRSLAIGVRGLPPHRTASVLERLQHDPDTYLQLYSQGGAAEAAEADESRLRSLETYLADHPDDLRARAALASHLAYLADAPNIATDQREHYFSRALGHLEGLDFPRAHALRAALCIGKKDVSAASEALDRLAESDPGSRSVDQVEAATRVAEFLHLSRRWDSLKRFLGESELATDPGSLPVREFFGAHPLSTRSAT